MKFLLNFPASFLLLKIEQIFLYIIKVVGAPIPTFDFLFDTCQNQTLLTFMVEFSQN